MPLPSSTRDSAKSCGPSAEIFALSTTLNCSISWKTELRDIPVAVATAVGETNVVNVDGRVVVDTVRFGII